MSWTPERVARLAELWAKGFSASMIAADLGDTTRNAVIGKRIRLGLPDRISTVRTRRSRRSIKPRARPKRIWDDLPPPDAQQSTEPVADLPPEQRRSFQDLEAGDCRWPIGDPKSVDFGFCNKKSMPGQSYCAHHCRVAYEPPKVRARKQTAAQPKIRTFEMA